MRTTYIIAKRSRHSVVDGGRQGQSVVNLADKTTRACRSWPKRHMTPTWKPDCQASKGFDKHIRVHLPENGRRSISFRACCFRKFFMLWFIHCCRTKIFLEMFRAILTVRQIESTANDPLIRYSALLSMICALMSLLFSCIYIIRFGTMRKPYKAEWAQASSHSSNMLPGVRKIKTWNFLECLGAPRYAISVVIVASFFRTLCYGIDSVSFSCF